MGVRFPIDPRMIPASKVARRLGLTLRDFEGKLPMLIESGFPAADPILGTYCLQAVDRWIDERTGLNQTGAPLSPAAEMKRKLADGSWLK